MLTLRSSLFAIALGLCLSSAQAQPEVAEEDAVSETEPARVTRARALFVEGAELAKKMRWGEARSRFEASNRLHPHPGTSYNIGVCERALGHFTRARQAFRDALADRSALDESMKRDAAVFLSELDAVIAELKLTLEPANVRILVDGRPLDVIKKPGGPVRAVAGTRPPGRAEKAPGRTFVIEADPGNHLLVVSRTGYADVLRRIDLAPGARRDLALSLKRLPGELSIDANQPGAAVSVNGLDVGIAPVKVRRPSGRYRVLVRKPGFESYATDATLKPGGSIELDAALRREPVLLTERWWFWAGIGAAVVGIGVGTYYATRPDPERPPVSGGNLGWSVRVP